MASQIRYLYIWLLLFAAIASGCSSIPSVELKSVPEPTRIHVTWQFRALAPKVIDKPEQLASIQKFVNARLDGWRDDRRIAFGTPAAVPRDPLINIEFYSNGKFVGMFGVGKLFFSRLMSGVGAVSRKASQEEIEELFRLLELRLDERLIM